MMTAGKITLFIGGFVAVFALGVATSPAIRVEWARMHDSTGTVATTANAPAPASAERPAAPARAASMRSHEAAAPGRTAGAVRTMAVAEWQPQVRDRVQAVLNDGAKLDIAAADFKSPEQFVTVAHAARDTQIPFVLLKDRVLNHHESLAEAIHGSKPRLNAPAEVARARAAARADLGMAG